MIIKQISWAEYCTAMAVLCAVYYFVIIVLYFRREVFELISGKRKLLATAPLPSSSPHHPAANSVRTAEGNTSQEEKLFALTNQLMQELQPVFGNEYVKGELMTALQLILRKYPLLKGTAFQASVNNYIGMESENQCSVSLSEQELSGIWQG
jgi:hypothetical protein